MDDFNFLFMSSSIVSAPAFSLPNRIEKKELGHAHYIRCWELWRAPVIQLLGGLEHEHHEGEAGSYGVLL